MKNDIDVAGLLEASQFTSAKLARLPRRRLSRGVVALLVALRVYVFLAIPLVGYAFIHAVRSSQP